MNYACNVLSCYNPTTKLRVFLSIHLGGGVLMWSLPVMPLNNGYIKCVSRKNMNHLNAVTRLMVIITLLLDFGLLLLCLVNCSHSTIIRFSVIHASLCIYISRCVCGCCLVPFFVDQFKDTIHKCPNCHVILGKYRKL